MLKRFIQPLRLALIDTAKQISEAKLTLVASSLAYTTILSIIPLLALSFAIFQAFGGLDKLYETLSPMVLENLAEGTSDEAIRYLDQFIRNAHGNAIGVGGFIGLVLTSMSMLSSFEKAVNHVWNTPIKRRIFERIAAYWLFITLGPIAISVVVGVASSSNFPLANLMPGGTGMFLMTVAVLFSIYKFVPYCRVEWRYALISGSLVAILMDFARLGYQVYTRKVITYSKIYGSLGAVPILLLWIYIVWLIVLGGAALSAALQKRYELTTGGKRGVQA